MTVQRTEIVELIRSGESLQGHQLPGVNLRGADLRGADLRDANFNGANLFGAELEGANLQGATLVRADLQYANLNDASLEGADLRRAKLHSGQLRKADLTRANLGEADLSRANLTGATLDRCNLEQARFRKALLDAIYGEDANFSFADLREASLKQAHLVSALLKHARLEDAHLEAADLSQARLENADLTGASLDRAKLDETVFRGTRMKGCSIAGIAEKDLESCDWEGAVGRGDPAPVPPPPNQDETDILPRLDVVVDEEIPEAVALPGLTVELDADRLSTEHMIRCLLFFESVIKETSRVIRIVQPDHPAIGDDEIQVIGAGSEPARIVITSSTVNQAAIYALLLHKKAQIDGRKITRARVGAGFGRDGIEEDLRRRDRAEEEAHSVLSEVFDEKVVREILSFVPEQLDAKYGGPLIRLLRQLTLAPEGVAPRVYRFRQDMQLTGVFSPR